MATPTPLPPEALARRTDPASIPFETTADAPDLAGPLGQDRAVEALRLAVGLRQPGFNAFVAGPPQSGRHRAVRELLEAQAATEPVPQDVCYVHDFAPPTARRRCSCRPAAARRSAATWTHCSTTSARPCPRPSRPTTTRPAAAGSGRT